VKKQQSFSVVGSSLSRFASIMFHIRQSICSRYTELAVSAKTSLPV